MRHVCFAALLLAFCLTCALPAPAKTLWVVLLPGTSLSDWQRADAPALHQILVTGSLGLMNTRTARTASDHVRETPESAALTLGAGSRAAASTADADFSPSAEKSPVPGVTTGQLYTRRMGIVPPAGQWVNLSWPRVLRENANQGYDLHPGNLTDALVSRNIPVEAAGGLLALLAAASGRGDVAPFAGTAPPNGCVIWDAGSNIPAAAKLLMHLTASLGNGRLIVLSPCADAGDYARGARLCPVAVWGKNVPPGLLISDSTRRPGLVTDTDFATEVSSYFGVPLTAFPARPFGAAQGWQFRRELHALPALERMDAGALSQWNGMRALPYLALFLGVWMLGAALLARHHRLPRWAVSVPPVVVLAALLADSSLSLALWLAAGAALAVWMRPVASAMLIGGILLGDMLLGDPLMRQSLLGYSAIEGARYYGIGNEAMGALIGSAQVLAFWAWPRLRPQCRRLVWAVFAGIALLLGSPLAGAKAGGIVVAVASFSTAMWMQSGRRWSARVGMAAAGAALGALVVVAALDAHWGGRHASHLGQATARLSTGGIGEWGDIIRRKLAVEGKLLWHSAWAAPLWGGLAALFFSARRAQEGNVGLLVSGLVAVAACLAVNDAGVVAASLCIVMLWSCLVEQEQQKRPAAC